MQTSFYTSGFLYHLRTNQILLLKMQQKDSADFLWSTLEGEGNEDEETHIAFQRIINRMLNLSLKEKHIYSIYDYFHDEKGKNNFVFYAEVKSTPVFNPFEGKSFAWVGFDELSKLKFVPRTKQDIIVGERVIKAKWREDEAQKIASFTEIIL